MLRGPIRHGSDRGNGQTANVDDGGASAPIPYPVSRKASSAPPFFRAPARTRKAMMSGRFKPRSGASRLYPSCPFRVTIDLTDPNSTKPLSGPGNPQKAPSSPLRSATSSFPRTASIASSQSIRHSAQLQCCAVANRANSSFGNTTEARSQAPSTAANKAGSTRPVLAARCTSSKCAQPFSASGQSTLKAHRRLGSASACGATRARRALIPNLSARWCGNCRADGGGMGDLPERDLLPRHTDAQISRHLEQVVRYSL